MLTVSVIIFGTIGIFRRNIDLDSGILAMLRGYIGSISLLIIMAVTGKGLNKEALRKNGKLLVISGAMIGLNWMLLFEAYNYTTVAVATVCYYMAPVFVLMASPFVFKRKEALNKRVRDGLCIIIAFVGMVLVSGLSRGPGTSDIKGVILGLLAALLYAAVVTVNQFIKNIPAYDKTIGQLFVAATVLLPYVILTGGIRGIGDMTPFTSILVLIVGVVNTGLAYALYFGSMDALSEKTVALLGYIDPIVAIILSAILLFEPMPPMQIAGTVLVLAATLVGGLGG